MSETATTPPGAALLTHRQILTILSGLLMGMFLAALDQMIVATAMKTIADELNGQTVQAWATTAYLITATISTPLYGKLSDIYGRKPLYLTAISLFLVGSLLCGIANSMYELAAFRAVQGLGAGGLMSLAFAILADITSPRERSRYAAYFMIVFGTSSVAGPVVGGLFAGMETFLGTAGWRWVFLINVPIALVALAVVAKVLNVPHKRVDHRVDYLGALMLAVGLVPLLVVAEQGREWGWASTTAVAMYVVGVLGLIGFVLAERRMGDEALLPLRLFRKQTFSMGNTINFVLGAGMFGGMVSIPLYLQIVKGYSATDAGLMMLPMTLGIMSAANISGRITAVTGRYKIFPVIGFAVLTVTLFVFSRVGVDTPVWQPLVLMFSMGIGLGLCMQTLLIAIQNAAEPRDMGVATSSATFFRQIGGTVGTAVFLSILFSTVTTKIAEALREAFGRPEFQAALARPENREFAASLQSGGSGMSLDNTEFLTTLDPVLARPFLEGFSEAIGTVFVVGGVVTAVGFAIVWFLREVPLSTRSNLERVRDEEEAAAPPVAVH
ncbi:MDR family MFS transporter [Saccharothrix coeruleofusca]|uniref:MFS transporter n=1 Tax=Saccharothrix coeruleofusca TaxID=33919 RepID=A0A918AGV0_9PSEU|nr:MDR family MFS transporter [Saccharothrix coeruleofusca]MBP2340351.1 EmrB/QacA subfamily drug resistance transporter [Saccharothrix coeruleofusca]GGP35909.1 MFS transporter [Saccharothrix coeruleofusca]